jgi:two-component system sensor kinase FixL
VPTITVDDLRAPHDSRRDAEPRLRALLDAAVDAIITIDQHGLIESINPATEQLFGYSAEELLGSNVSMLMPAPHRTHHDGYIQRYLMTGERRIIGIGREVEARRKDGSLFPVDLAITEFELDGVVMFTGLVRDISDRRAAERDAQARLDELAHAGRLADLGLTTSTIAHEVNQPLAAIVSFAHACQRILDSEQPDQAVLRDALAQIAEQGERASAIISRIRDMARRGERAHERVDLHGTGDAGPPTQVPEGERRTGTRGSATSRAGRPGAGGADRDEPRQQRAGGDAPHRAGKPAPLDLDLDDEGHDHA